MGSLPARILCTAARMVGVIAHRRRAVARLSDSEDSYSGTAPAIPDNTVRSAKSGCSGPDNATVFTAAATSFGSTRSGATVRRNSARSESVGNRLSTMRNHASSKVMCSAMSIAEYWR